MKRTALTGHERRLEEEDRQEASARHTLVTALGGGVICEEIESGQTKRRRHDLRNTPYFPVLKKLIQVFTIRRRGNGFAAYHY
jgi:hypothetical protein